MTMQEVQAALVVDAPNGKAPKAKPAPRVLKVGLKPTNRAEVGDNALARVEGGKLIIEIDCSPDALDAAQLSKGGKMRLLANTHGFTRAGALPGTPFRFSVIIGI